MPDLIFIGVVALFFAASAGYVVLSVRDREEDRIAALDNGADDYVTKPFSTGELLARLREKLELNPAEPRLFLTEAGVGYRLVEQD